MGRRGGRGEGVTPPPPPKPQTSLGFGGGGYYPPKPNLHPLETGVGGSMGRYLGEHTGGAGVPWVRSETACGAVGEREWVKKLVAFERTQVDPHENVHHLLTLWRRAEASATEACRVHQPGQPTQLQLNQSDLRSMWRRNKVEESKPLFTSKPVPDKFGGKKPGTKDERLGMYEQSLGQDGQLEVSLKANN